MRGSFRQCILAAWLVAAGCSGGGGTPPAALPDTQISAAPLEPFFADRTAQFEFGAQGAAAIEVRVDGELVPVTDPFLVEGLAPGRHTVEACAINAAGVRDPTPAVHVWEVHDPLAVACTQFPAAVTAERSATIVFEANFEEATLVAELDGQRIGTVSSPFQIEQLDPGVHTFVVQAEVPEVGAVSPPAQITWTVTDAAPGLHVAFPPAASATDESTITVRGTGAGMAAVAVNGRPAISRDGFVTWSAAVDLAVGRNEIVVTAVDAAGGAEERRLTVRHQGPFLYTPHDVVYDTEHDRLLVMDERRATLFAVDAATGARTTLHRWFDEPEPTFRWIKVKPLLLDPDKNAVLVLRPGGTIDSIDLDSGAATRLVDGTESFSIVHPRALALDPVSRELFIADRFECTLHGLRLHDLFHRIVSDLHTGGSDLHFRDIIYHWLRRQVIIAGQGRWGGAVIDVEMRTGFRTRILESMRKPDTFDLDQAADVAVVVDEPVVKTWNFGTGEIETHPLPDGFANPLWASVAVQPGTTNAYLVDASQDSVVKFDRATGEYTRLSSDRVGEGAALGARDGDGVLDVTWDAAGHRTIAAVRYDEVYAFSYPHWSRDPQYAILAIDGATGDRTVIAADRSLANRAPVVAARGEGDSLTEMAALAVDPDGGILVLKSASSTLLHVDPATGDRTRIAQAPETGAWLTMTLDAANDRVLVRTAYSTLLAVSLETGDVRTLPGGLSAVRCMAVAADGERLYYIDTATTLRVLELATGRKLAALGDGFGSLDLAVDAATGELIVLETDRVAALDATTGELRTVADSTGGFFPLEPAHVALDPGRRLALVASSGAEQDLRGLFAIDLETGACVVGSKD